MTTSHELRLELKRLVGALLVNIEEARERGDDLSFLKFDKPAKVIEEATLHLAASPRRPSLGLTLPTIRKELGDCRRCLLCRGRLNIVFGEGNDQADLVFVGEGPGEDEDKMGRPFVGRAGQLLNKIIAAMGLCREEVYICNIVKCRPPGNRPPKDEEIAACEPFLMKQLEVIKPRIICALGSSAARTLLKTDQPISLLRGNFHSYQGIMVMPTYHPAYLLRNPGAKKQVWEDMQLIMGKLKGMTSVSGD